MPDDAANILAGLTLFADLDASELEAVVDSLPEELHATGQRILRQGFRGSGLFFILDGEAAVLIDGEQRAVLHRGDYFGEVSVLLGDPPVADVVALSPLRCLELAGREVEAFLIAHPRLLFRMLQAEARRLRNANTWRS